MALLSGRRGHARVVLLSIIEEELEAVQAVFGATGEIGVTGIFTVPECAVDGVSHYPFVVARTADRSNTPANSSTRELLEWFRPEVVLVVGIGGGIQRKCGTSGVSGPQLGDVVIGRYVHYANYTKNLPSGSFLRYISLDQPSSRLIAQHAETIAAAPRDKCFSRLDATRPDMTIGLPNIHISEVIAVESIAGNPADEKQIEMLDRFDNADVIDMESMGVGRALHEYRTDPHYSPLWLPVRGVSDVVTADSRRPACENRAGQEPVEVSRDENSQQRSLWKTYASFAAACVARGLVERLLSDERPGSRSDPGAASWRSGLGDSEDVSGQGDTMGRDLNGP